ncbi:hypothetical protein HanIR_Chr13g0669791 [Helianthus annuus]|nr:hypothetical protein HanIR_Chr13g0669791 [Helianthus annuus]
MFVDCGIPKTTSNGIGVGGDLYVSGIDVSRFTSISNLVENELSRGVVDSCSSKAGGHCNSS